MTDDITRPADGVLSGDESRTGEPAEVGGLVRRAREGDREAFDQLVGLFQGRVWGVAWRLTGNREDAREVSQEAFLRAFRYIGSFREGLPFGPWILRITVHASHDHLRRTRPPVRLVPVEDERDEEPSALVSGDEKVLEDERRKVLFSLLDRLSERERSVFMLREVQGLSSREVAGILGIREATVRRHAGRARTRLLRILKEEFPELLGH